jgi:hypothetical protein
MQNGQVGVGDLVTTSALAVKADLPNESTAKELRRGQKSAGPTVRATTPGGPCGEALQNLLLEA